MRAGDALLALVISGLFCDVVTAYPIFGAEQLEIRRLSAEQQIQSGQLAGRKKLAGQLLHRDDIALRLTAARDQPMPPRDAALGAAVAALLGERADSYSISLIDASDAQAPRLIELNGNVAYHPGSVGKLLVAVAFFQALANAHPLDLAARHRLLRDTWVEADHFINYDTHAVRFFDTATETLTRRPIAIGDRANLWEYLDWMLSASSNAAASTVMAQTLLLTQFGPDYPVSPERARTFFAETDAQIMQSLFVRVFKTAIADNGINTSKFVQGSYFTKTANASITPFPSRATTREMVRFLWRMEQGLLVDEFSSLALKRLLYVTETRRRYAAAESLRPHAVYFKSGSLYACEAEESFDCRRYHGDKLNLMNSVAIVESVPHAPYMHYMVAVASNVLRRDSSLDHQLLANAIHRLLERQN